MREIITMVVPALNLGYKTFKKVISVGSHVHYHLLYVTNRVVFGNYIKATPGCKNDVYILVMATYGSVNS